MFGGGCEFQSNEQQYFNSEEYGKILEDIMTRDKSRKDDIDDTRNEINELTTRYIRKIDELNVTNR